MLVVNKICFEQLQPDPAHKVKRNFYRNRNCRSNVGNNYTDWIIECGVIVVRKERR